MRLDILKELHPDLTKQSGFDLDADAIKELASMSAKLITGKISYDEVEEELIKKCGKDFFYREGNKRIVLVSTKSDYVVKIAKLPGWEGIENNVTEYYTTEWYHENSAYKRKRYAPYPLLLIGNDEFPGLIFIQEKYTEILEAAANELRLNRSLSKKKVEETLVNEIIKRGYGDMKIMLDEINEEFFTDDTPMVASATNYGLNPEGGMAIVDWGSFVPKDGYEARCPECGSPMIFEVESLAAITKSGKVTLAAENVRPKYVCVATMHDELGRHDMDTDEFYQRLRSGNDDIIMTAKEAEETLHEINISQIDEDSKFRKDGATYYLGKTPVIIEGNEVLKVYDEDGKYIGVGMTEDEEFVDFN